MNFAVKKDDLKKVSSKDLLSLLSMFSSYEEFLKIEIPKTQEVKKSEEDNEELDEGRTSKAHR